MSIIGLSIAVIMTLILLVFVLVPFMRYSGRTNIAFMNRQRERALTYYERVLGNIRDLDEDHTTGKINAEDYQSEREVWMQRGVRLLKMIDELDAEQNIVHNTEADDAEIDAAIEAAIAQHKSKIQSE